MKCLPVALSLMAVLIASAAEPASKPETTKPTQQEEVLKNSSVIELQELGLGETVIVEKIQASKCDFDVSINGLKQLKASKVPDAVIKAMLTANAYVKKNGDSASEVAGDPNDPTSPHESGIWLSEEKANKAKMTKLEPSVYSQAKTGGGMFMGYGATMKSRATIRSAHAEIETTNRRPVFYFYFEKTQSGLSDTRNSATSPNEFLLSQFEVSEKNNHRSLVLGEMNAFTGGKSGADSKSVRSFSFEKRFFRERRGIFHRGQLKAAAVRG